MIYGWWENCKAGKLQNYDAKNSNFRSIKHIKTESYHKISFIMFAKCRLTGNTDFSFGSIRDLTEGIIHDRQVLY